MDCSTALTAVVALGTKTMSWGSARTACAWDCRAWQGSGHSGTMGGGMGWHGHGMGHGQSGSHASDWACIGMDRHGMP